MVLPLQMLREMVFAEERCIARGMLASWFRTREESSFEVDGVLMAGEIGGAAECLVAVGLIALVPLLLGGCRGW